VHESRLDELKAGLVKAYEQVRIGDPLDPKTLMGPLIDESAIERVEAALAAVDRSSTSRRSNASRQRLRPFAMPAAKCCAAAIASKDPAIS
jgi:acyl-CoA reductase-like NAD-dependent aldehyde dehydrogenase